MSTPAIWQFRCPECGFGHTEHGHMLSAHEIYCIVCLDEDGRQIRLYRWEAELMEDKAD